MNNEKNSLHSDSRGVIPTAKGFGLLGAGFFVIMKIEIQFTESEIKRIRAVSAAIGFTPEEWVHSSLLDVLEAEEAQIAEEVEANA